MWYLIELSDFLIINLCVWKCHNSIFIFTLVARKCNELLIMII